MVHRKGQALEFSSPGLLLRRRISAPEEPCRPQEMGVVNVPRDEVVALDLVLASFDVKPSEEQIIARIDKIQNLTPKWTIFHAWLSTTVDQIPPEEYIPQYHETLRYCDYKDLETNDLYSCCSVDTREDEEMCPENTSPADVLNWGYSIAPQLFGRKGQDGRLSHKRCWELAILTLHVNNRYPRDIQKRSDEIEDNPAATDKLRFFIRRQD